MSKVLLAHDELYFVLVDIRYEQRVDLCPLPPTPCLAVLSKETSCELAQRQLLGVGAYISICPLSESILAVVIWGNQRGVW